MADRPRSATAMIIVLTAIAMASGLALAGMSEVTREAIRVSRRADLKASLKRILPPHANEADQDVTRCVAGADKAAPSCTPVKEEQAEQAEQAAPAPGSFPVYRARSKAGEMVGAAFETESSQGYGGLIRVLVAVDAQQHITGYSVLEHKETPGLGDNASKDDPESDKDFADQFKGKGLDNYRFAVTKDGGEVDAITSATITSRAVSDALMKGLERYRKVRGTLEPAGARGGSR